MTAAGLACAGCGRELRSDAKFCHECAAPTGATKAAEYKQVTVLFADVVHSMTIAAAVRPERLREIMAELVRRATRVVRRYGGTLDMFIGDGIMALFGAPTALEDYAFRACLASRRTTCGRHATSWCYGYGGCSPGRGVIVRATAGSKTKWLDRLGLKGISRGPRRCHSCDWDLRPRAGVARNQSSAIPLLDPFDPTWLRFQVLR